MQSGNHTPRTTGFLFESLLEDAAKDKNTFKLHYCNLAPDVNLSPTERLNALRSAFFAALPMLIGEDQALIDL